MGRDRRAPVRIGYRSRAARPGLQHVDRRGRRHHARTAQRPELRVRRRGPDPSRHDGRPTDEGRPGSAHHGRPEALRAQRPGNGPQHRQRRARRAVDARDRPAGVRNRAPDLPGRRRDVRLQQGQWRLGLRERLPPQPRPQAQLRVQRVGSLGLGRHAQHDEGDRERPGPGNAGQRLFRRCAEKGDRGGRSPTGARGRCGPPHPAVDVRRRGD